MLENNLDVVFCGTAKGTTSAKESFYYARSGNQFYSILHKPGFTHKELSPKECFEICQYRIGLTDLVHNQSGNDNELDDANYDVIGFTEKSKKYQPKYVAFNGKKAAAFVLGYKGKTKHVEFGLQKDQTIIGKSKLYVLPQTSGSARKYWDEKYWFELREKYLQK